MITKIQSNIKGKNINAQLYEKTLIVGPSASGKSAIIGAVELALGGKISDVQGRDSAFRTVNKLLAQEGIKLEASYTGEKPKLLFYDVKNALMKSPLQTGLALLQLINVRLDAAAEYQAFSSLRKQPQDRVRAIEGVLALPELANTELLAAAIQLKALRNSSQTEVDRLGLVIDGLESQLTEQVTDRLKSLVLCAEPYVPEQLGALVLQDGKVGLRRDNLVRYGLSGSEWNIVITALACGVAEITKQPATVIPEDRAIDVDLLFRWMVALRSAPCQVLVTSIPLHSSNHLPEPWELLFV